MLNLTPLILLLPLAGFVVLGLFGRALPRGFISLVACGMVLAAFVLAVVDFVAMLASPRRAAKSGHLAGNLGRLQARCISTSACSLTRSRR